MIRQRVERSPARQFLMGVVGLVLIIAAVDIVWGHWLSTPPDEHEGVVTSKGRAQQRADLIWGGAFLIGGTALFGTAVVTLVRRRPVLLILEDGIELYVTGPSTSSFVEWDAVRSLRSGRDLDEDTSRARDVLIVDIAEPGDLPDDPWGAVWEGSELRIDAGGWHPDVAEVAVHGQLAMEEYHRDHPE